MTEQQPIFRTIRPALRSAAYCVPFLILFALVPVGLVARADSAPRSGEQIYRVYCGSCHGSGWQSAPIAYDEQEWQPRMVKGLPALVASAKKGVNTMPPMGTCMDCSDAELTAAIEEMLRF